MTTPALCLCLLILPGVAPPADEPIPATVEDTKGQQLADRFAALKRQFEAREKVFYDELNAANKLEAKARAKKITDENRSYQRDWFATADKVRELIRAHPADPASFEGIILLPGVMRSFLDDDLVAVVREKFLNDPRMGRLCESLAYRPEDGTVGILKDVAAKHPDRTVRGQAIYALGVRSSSQAREMFAGRNRTEAEQDQCLAEAKRFFTQVTADFADVRSTDGTYRLADKAKAELARIANLPNLKVGKVAPEIVGETLDGKPMKLSDYRGKVVVVCFWATWCGPCMAMVPHERELVARTAGKPFALLGVNSDEAPDRAKAKKVTLDKQMTWPSWWDGGFRGAIQTAYDVDHWPTVYVLDARGVIRFFDVRDKDLDRAVDSLLSETDAPARDATP